MELLLKVGDFLKYGIPGLGLAVLVVVAVAIVLLFTKKKTPLPAKSYGAIWALTGLAAFVFVVSAVLDYLGKDPRAQISELVSDRMEQEFVSTGSGKRKRANELGVSAEQLQEILLRKATFMNIYYLRADPRALAAAIEVLRQRGIELSDAAVAKTTKGFPDIVRERYRWLVDVATPALQRRLDELDRHPQIQEDASVVVALPKNYEILPEVKRMTTLNDLKSLQIETEFIKRNIK